MLEKKHHALIIQYLRENKFDTIKELIKKDLPYDVSKCYEKIPQKYRRKFIRKLQVQVGHPV